jgi:hypothetical protein
LRLIANARLRNIFKMSMHNNAQQIQSGANHQHQQQQQTASQQYSVAPGSIINSMPLRAEGSMVSTPQLTQVMNGQTITGSAPVVSMSNMQVAPVIGETATILNNPGSYVQTTSIYSQSMTLNSIPNIVASSNEVSSAQILTGKS